MDEQLKDLSPQEREMALKILKELANGKSSTLNQLRYQDYKEIPADIETFIKDDKYLGKAWHTSSGEFKLFPYWMDKLKQLFPDNLTTKMNNAIFSGARGLGKSEIAVTCLLYMMHRVMCMKDARDALNIKPTEKICFAMMNITKTLAEDIAVSKFQNTVQLSPWFKERGSMTQRNNMPYWIPPDPVDIIIGSQSSHVIGQPIYAAFFDEISFIRNQDIDKQKKIAIDMIDTAIGGQKTRFYNKGKSPTILILASSKRSEKSFLEEHMKKKLSDEGEAKNTLIVDEPVWNIRPASDYSGKKFKVAVGNKYLPSEVLPLDANAEEWAAKGYRIIDVPIEFKSDFFMDIDRALCDFAGISSSDLTKYISGTRLNNCKDNNLHNLFTKDVIEVGDAKEDTTQYFDFINLERVDKEMKYKPMYIHLDMSLSGDCTGIAGVWMRGKRAGSEGGAKEMYYQLAFNISVKAPKGHQVSFAKNRRFIYWLKENGFNIKGISSDTYARSGIEQDLLSRGYDYSIISVDRCNTDRVCEPYAYFKNTIYEERIAMYKSEKLDNEIVNLERDGNTGKIDHPEHGSYGSKDASDAVCGALWNASLHAEEYGYEWGEDIESVLNVSLVSDEDRNQKQLVVDFEEELQRMAQEQATKEVGIDFGMGGAISDWSYQSAMYAMNGILI